MKISCEKYDKSSRELYQISAEDFDFFTKEAISSREYIIAKNEHGQIIGILCFKPSIYEDAAICFSFLSVKQEFKKMGVAKALLQFFDEWSCLKSDIDFVIVTDYTEEGFKYLKPLIHQMRYSFNKRWLDKNEYIKYVLCE